MVTDVHSDINQHFSRLLLGAGFRTGCADLVKYVLPVPGSTQVLVPVTVPLHPKQFFGACEVEQGYI